MIDYESLLEFEESLRSSSVSNNLILLDNLELKIECARSTSNDTLDTSHLPEFTESDLDTLFDKYRFCDDEFNTCSKCGRSLGQVQLYQACCKAFVHNKSIIPSKLEKSYWLSFINNPTRTINTLPNYTEFLCLQQGIPYQLRSRVWNKLFLLNTNDVPQASILVYQNFQHSYNSEISNQISKDLNRTFPTVSFFKNEETIKNLSTILNVYANYDAELGYCQGLLFLVGVLYYNFHGNCELTFHCMVTIMESEDELHDIFTTTTMCPTLESWYKEFLYILKSTDKELHDHLTSFVELHAFLYQWWLSFISSHSPDLSIVNRIMDFCIIQGWKTGLFKISLGLLIINKPILMSLQKGDEEVIYQHLLNESKWGNVINDLDLFFGDLLLKWDESLFVGGLHESEHEVIKPRAQASSLVGRLKKFSLGLSGSGSGSSASSLAGSTRERSDSSDSASAVQNQSSLSVFSHAKNAGQNTNNHELESIYSDISEVSSNEPGKSFTDYLKLPYLSKRGSSDQSESSSPTIDANQLLVENHTLKGLLKKAYGMLEEGSESAALKKEIAKFLEV